MPPLIARTRAAHRASPPTPSAAGALPAPSDEQRAIIDAVLAGSCARVIAVPGAGKTTCAILIASSFRHGEVLIATYNNALAAESQTRLEAYGLSPRVRALTYHSLVGRAAETLVPNDARLLEVVESWEAGSAHPRPFSPALLIVDEAQDLTPLLLRALLAVLRTRTRAGPIQIVACGDPDQLLYDFGGGARRARAPDADGDGCDVRVGRASAMLLHSECASAEYLLHAPTVFAESTAGRQWVDARLAQSYRLTPSVAAVCNLYWRREIIGASSAVDLPVHFLRESPFGERVTTMIAHAIAEHGPENVLVLSQSVRASSPAAQQVNRLLQRHPTFAFHLRGGSCGSSQNDSPLVGKTRVWTFCSSKGIEADVVFVLGISLHSTTRVAPINQVCVAMSRAKKRLIIVHARGASDELYPARGDPELVEHTRDGLRALQRAGQLDISGGLPTEPVPVSTDARTYACTVGDLARAPARLVRALVREHIERLDGGTGPTREDIQFATQARVSRSVEDLSSAIGSAVPLALQSRLGVEPTALTDMLNVVYVGDRPALDRRALLEMLRAEDNISLETADEERLCELLPGSIVRSSAEVCEALNAMGCIASRGGRVVEFRAERRDAIFSRAYMARVRAAYDAPGPKQPHVWCYLANAEAAYRSIHDRFVQTSTHCAPWAACIEAASFVRAVDVLEAHVGPGGSFEVPLSVPVGVRDARGDEVRELRGRVDWIRGQQIVEFKCVQALTDTHDLQAMVYAAMVAINTNACATCTLVNARTAESRAFRAKPASAHAFLRGLLECTLL